MPGDARIEEPEHLPDRRLPGGEQSQLLDDDLDDVDVAPLRQVTYPDIQEPEPDKPELDPLITAPPPKHHEFELNEPETDSPG